MAIVLEIPWKRLQAISRPQIVALFILSPLAAWFTRHPNPIGQSRSPPRLGTRVSEIDGLRGWAALSVMCFHIFHETLGALEPVFRAPLLAPIMNGDMAVTIFFVLSGDALSASYWLRQSRDSVVKLVVRRYFRLVIPIFAACLAVFLLMKAGLIFSHEAAAIARVNEWLGVFLSYQYGVFDLVKYTTADVFFRHSMSGSLNPFLWTMQVELEGSLVVFVYLLVDAQIRRKSAAMAFMLFVCLAGDSFLACFIVGMLMGRVRAEDGLGWLRRQRVASEMAIPVALASLIAGAYFARSGTSRHLPLILASSVLVLSVCVSPMAGRFLSAPLSQWLGRISFPLYLMHFPVIASFASGLVVFADVNGVLVRPVIWMIGISSAGLSLIAAVLFSPVDGLTARAGDWICRAAMLSEAASDQSLRPANN